MDAMTAVEASYDYLGKIAASVGPDDLGRATPCPKWDVRTLVNHLLDCAITQFTNGLENRPVTPYSGGQPTRDLAGSAPAAALAGAITANLDAWRQPGLFDREIDTPPGRMPATMAAGILVTEILGHGWDLAKATGQDSTIPEDVARYGFDVLCALPLDEFRAMGSIGPEVAVSQDATIAHRLLGLLGRQP